MGLCRIKVCRFHKEPVEQLVPIPMKEEVRGKVLSEILCPHSRPLHPLLNISPQSLSVLCVYRRVARVHKVLAVVDNEVRVPVVLDSQICSPPVAHHH